jgi:hypothetical protein
MSDGSKGPEVDSNIPLDETNANLTNTTTSISPENENKIIMHMRQVFDSHFCEYIKVSYALKIFKKYEDRYCVDNPLYPRKDIKKIIEKGEETKTENQINPVQYAIYCFLLDKKADILNDLNINFLEYKYIAWDNSVAKSDYLCKYMNRGKLLIDKYTVGVEFTHENTKYRIQLVDYEKQLFSISTNDNSETKVTKISYQKLNKPNRFYLPEIIQKELQDLIEPEKKSSNAILSYIKGCLDKTRAESKTSADLDELSVLINTVYKLLSNERISIDKHFDIKKCDEPILGKTILGNLAFNNKCKNQNEYFNDKNIYKGNEFNGYLKTVINTHSDLLKDVFGTYKPNTIHNITVFLHDNEHVSLIRQIQELERRKKQELERRKKHSFFSRIFGRGGKKRTRKYKKRNTRKRQPRKSRKLKHLFILP